MSSDLSLIRNFSIVAHVDHGKTTLADRLIERCGALAPREQVDQFLDKMDIERERGITIKAQAICLEYIASDGKKYCLNLIDTPGHVDFHYEVSRSLAACEGVLLIVDAAQGVEAQTVANTYLAIDNNLEIIPVLNKIDLPSARPEEVCQEIESAIGLDATDAVHVSAKTGSGIDELLEAIVVGIPPPTTTPGDPVKGLVFDSWYDPYRGVMALVRIISGHLSNGMNIRFWATDKTYECSFLCVYKPFAVEVNKLGPGEVGVFSAQIKDIQDARVGDTITDADNPCKKPLAGFKDVKPMVFAGLFPVDSSDYEQLKEALGKLVLNDAAVSYDLETSDALGFGFRCGFLGLLHMEIIQERLEREYNLNLITTAPSVRYRVHINDSEVLEVDNPARFPDLGQYKRIEEPSIRASIHVPQEYIGAVMNLCEERRGNQIGIEYSKGGRACIEYYLPLAEVVFGFHDRLKTLSRGYASLDYEPSGYGEADLVRTDIRINGDKVDALSLICHRSVAVVRGRELCTKMKDIIPRQMYEVAIQAVLGSRVITRVNVRALRKDVTAKCYGGDISRKRKLLEKQKKGKRRMKSVGSIELPQEAFLAVLQVD